MVTQIESGQLRLMPEWLTSYRKEWLRMDMVAGLTAAAVVIPKSMAYATVAGLPLQVGLYTAFLPMIIYAFIGSSRPLSVSTTTTLAILVGAELSEVASNSTEAQLLAASATLTVLVGAMLVLAAVLRLGFVANFISEPVLIGFKAGIGVVIVVDQIPKILGVHLARGSFVQHVTETIVAIPRASLVTVAIGASTIVLLIAFKKLAPKAPAPLIAVAAGIAAAYLFELQVHGVELVGRIPQGLPSISRPDIGLVVALWPGAIAIALMSFTETIAVGRAFASNDEPTPRPNRELLATGVANIGAAFFGAMASGGGTSQTAVNRLAGARTQCAELVTAAMTLVTMLVLAPLIALMPQATLAAVVIVYSVGLIKPLEFREIVRVRRTEFIWAIVAVGGVVLLGTLKGILVAIIVSLVALAFQVANPAVYVLRRKPGTNVFRPLSDDHSQDESFAGLLLLRITGRIFFANAEQIGDRIRFLVRESRPQVLAVELSGVPDLEYTALKMLTAAAIRTREHGPKLWLVAMNPRVLRTVQRSHLAEVIGPDAMHANLELAVSKYLADTRYVDTAQSARAI